MEVVRLSKPFRGERHDNDNIGGNVRAQLLFDAENGNFCECGWFDYLKRHPSSKLMRSCSDLRELLEQR